MLKGDQIPDAPIQWKKYRSDGYQTQENLPPKVSNYALTKKAGRAFYVEVKTHLAHLDIIPIQLQCIFPKYALVNEKENVRVS